MLSIIYINDKLQSHDKSLSVNLPNIFKREGWSDTNSFATSIKDILSTISGFSFSKVRELNLFCFIVDRSHVLSCLNFEKDCSGVADVAPLVKTSLAIKTTFLISLRFSWDNNWIPLTISPKLNDLQSSKMTGSNFSLVIKES